MSVAREPTENPPNGVRQSGPGLTFCDVSSFYAPASGGIRTYHQAKLEWLTRQHRHRYVLLYPGRRFAVDRVAANVTIVTVYAIRNVRPGGARGSGLRIVDSRAGRGRDVGTTADLTALHIFNRGDRADFVRAIWQATDADSRDEARAGLAVAQGYGTWPQAITREVEGY